MNCFTCGIETANPKFCSRSCSAKTTNKASRKRKREGSCDTCGDEIKSCHKYCETCRNLVIGIQHKTTVIEHRSNLSWRNFHVSMRAMARANFKKTDRPKVCLCGYSLHVDIAHIIPISDFPDDTLLSVINHPDNLIALCKNCHWEHDNGYLKLSSPTGIRTQTSQASPH
jgi:hypothetical protein